jgi:hypothetical protein
MSYWVDSLLVVSRTVANWNVGDSLAFSKGYSFTRSANLMPVPTVTG